MACLLGSQSAGMAPALETGTIEQVGLTRGKPHIGWPRVLMTGLLGLSRHVATVHAECDAFSTGKSPALKHSKAGHHSLGQNLPIGSKVLDPSGPEVHLLFAAVDVFLCHQSTRARPIRHNPQAKVCLQNLAGSLVLPKIAKTHGIQSEAILSMSQKFATEFRIMRQARQIWSLGSHGEAQRRSKLN